MLRTVSLGAALLPMMVTSLCPAVEPGRAVRRLPAKEYLDKMAGGWVGQMAGVGWGSPIEFEVVGQIVPPAKVPPWKPDMVNEFDRRSSDDLWVEMTFASHLGALRPGRVDSPGRHRLRQQPLSGLVF